MLWVPSYYSGQYGLRTSPAAAGSGISCLWKRPGQFYKHPGPDYVSGAQNIHAATSGYVYHITFHTDTGEILKLYMNPDRFFPIAENAVGMLSWQGSRFRDFIPEEKKEV